MLEQKDNKINPIGKLIREFQLDILIMDNLNVDK